LFLILLILHQKGARVSQYSDHALGWMTWGSISSRAREFSSHHCIKTALGPTQPPIQWVLGVLSAGVKWQGCEADHSSPSSAKVMNVWSYTSTPPMWCCGTLLCTGTTSGSTRHKYWGHTFCIGHCIWCLDSL